MEGVVDNTLADEEVRKEREPAEASLQASEGLWRRVFENSAVGIALTDLEGRFGSTNTAYQELLGYTDEELRKLSFLDITIQEFQEQNRALVKDLLERKRQQFNIEKQYRRKDGSLVWVRNNVSLVPGADGAPRYIMAIVEDISERKRAESALQEAQAELTHVTRLTAMGELAASIAHEVTQPLTAIVANGDACVRWLNSEPAELDQARESVKRVIRDANRAGEVIKGVRELAKKSAMELAPLSMNELIAEVIALARGEIQRNRAVLSTVLTPHLPFVLGDRVQLAQVLLNLLLNAMEAMLNVAPGRRGLVVGSEIGEADGVVVYVRDCGPGISTQVMQNIFKPFFSTKPGGTGVGLSISKSIVEAHHGRLWTTTNLERGMTFSFSIPAVRQ
jgi:PAS domain S-box-containing protein